MKPRFRWSLRVEEKAKRKHHLNREQVDRILETRYLFRQLRGEEFKFIGRGNGQLITVIAIRDGWDFRVKTARHADRREKRLYHREVQP